MSGPIQTFILAEARRLIEQPETWCQGAFAVGTSGRRLVRGSPRAARHCALSALTLAARSCVPKRREADQLVAGIVTWMAPADVTYDQAERYVWSINDRHGHAAVLDLFDTAVALR
jgi:hypothetical protein